MANTVLTMQQIRSILQLLEKGFSYRSIAQELKINRKPVTTYGKRIIESGLSFKELRQLSDAELSKIVYPSTPSAPLPDPERRKAFDKLVGYMLSELKRTGVTRQLLWEEYKRDNPDGYGYTQFCILLKEAANTVNPTMRIVHWPANMLMIDFAGDKMCFVNKSTGELIECLVLVAVLPFSDYCFAIALLNASMLFLIHALNKCLEYFGGVPIHFKTDNMKQVVAQSCRYEPLFTDAIQQWALHYNIALLATRVKKPKDKAAVENEVKIAYRRIYAPLRNEIFFSIEELNAAISKQLEIHNHKIFQGKDISRRHLFDKEEKSLLQQLLDEPFVIKHKTQAKVQKNYHITLGEDWHHYSVPYTYGKTVTAVYNTNIVEIYYQLQRIALHKRSFKKHDFTTIAHHMPDGHRSYFEQQGWTPDYFLGKATTVGPNTAAYMQGILKARQFTEQTYNACRGILRLHNDYGSERLELACMMALKGSSYNYRTIQNILMNNRDKLLQVQSELFRIPEHQNLRGPDAYT